MKGRLVCALVLVVILAVIDSTSGCLKKGAGRLCPCPQEEAPAHSPGLSMRSAQIRSIRPKCICGSICPNCQYFKPPVVDVVEPIPAPKALFVDPGYNSGHSSESTDSSETKTGCFDGETSSKGSSSRGYNGKENSRGGYSDVKYSSRGYDGVRYYRRGYNDASPYSVYSVRSEYVPIGSSSGPLECTCRRSGTRRYY